MKETPKIKTDLFRFVPFRGPDQLNYETKRFRFVEHPNIAKSMINSCPVPAEKESSNKECMNMLANFRVLKIIRI